MAADIRMIRSLVEQLRATPPHGGRALSVYLDTTPARLDGHAYRAAFDAGYRALADALDLAERQHLVTAADQVGRYLYGLDAPHGRGLAIFATDMPADFCAIALPMSLGDAVDWGPRPRLDSLKQLIAAAERVAATIVLDRPSGASTIRLGHGEAEALDAGMPGAPGDAPAMDLQRRSACRNTFATRRGLH